MKNLILLATLLMSVGTWAQENYSEMIPYPFYVKQTSSENKVMPIFDSTAALQKRLELIRKAKKNVEVEYFIYNTDMAGKIISRELVAAAKRGVTVRVLVDKSIAVFKLKDHFAKALADNGVEVRYYNDSPLIKISSMQFRNHRKLLSIDDFEAITGGRNIGDDYFSLSEHFNFDDSDIYVEGPVVKTMRETFDQYFDHKITERPDLKKIKEEDLKEATDFLTETPEEVEIRKRVEIIGNKVLQEKKLFVCPETTFATDAPGARFRKRVDPDFDEKFKFLRKTLFDKISTIDKSLTLSSPYLLANSHSNKLMKHLLSKNVDITVYTNSLASTDAIYVASNLYFDIYRWRKMGIKAYLHSGSYESENQDIPQEIKDAKWGTHSKVQIYESQDSSEIMIGTYNIDNRSNFYNSEMGLFCKGNDELTNHVKTRVMNLAKEGIEIHEDGKATDKHGDTVSVYGTSEEDVKLMKLIFLPSWLLKFLL